MSDVSGVSGRSWQLYGSIGFIVTGDVKGTPEGGRKLGLDTTAGPDKILAAPNGAEPTAGFFADTGFVSPSGLGARMGVVYAEPAGLNWTTTDAEAERAGAKAGDFVEVVDRSAIWSYKLHLTYTAFLSQQFSVTLGSGPMWSHIDYCSAGGDAGHLVGSGSIEHPNPQAVCSPGTLSEDRFGVNSLAEGAIRVTDQTALTAGVAYTFFPVTGGATLAVTLGVQLWLPQ